MVRELILFSIQKNLVNVGRFQQNIGDDHMNYDVIAARLSKEDKLVILDGGTGTEIYRRKVRSDPFLPWGLNGLVYRPDVVRRIHYDYFLSGAHVVTANCFYTTRYALQTVLGYESKIISEMAKSLTYLGVLLCRDAERLARRDGAEQITCVAGNVAPLEVNDPYDRTRVPLRGVALAEHAEKIQNLLEADVDLILIETMTTLYEASAALEAYDEVGKKAPFWISFSCDVDGRLYGKESMEEVVDLVMSYSPEVLLINCTPVEGVTRALEQLQRISPQLTLGAYGNVQRPVYPKSETWERREDLSPKNYATICKKWWTLGARVIGGCCGTTPEDIAEIAGAFSDKV